MINTFVWADLSALDPAAAREFYTGCFGWQYQELSDGYFSCSVAGHPTAGLFAMPEFFQNIGMPSFWMSYIHVDDLGKVVNDAEKLGAKVEIKSQAAPGGGTIALIRDPSGAGFTCYEGSDPGGRTGSGAIGSQVWNELHVSTIDLVEPFYSELFGWRIEATDSAGRYEIFAETGSSEAIAGIQVTSNELKGDKEYWGVYFAVDNLAEVSSRIKNHGGEVVARQPLGPRPALLAYDSQGAAFYVTEGVAESIKNNAGREYKWRAIAGLVLVLLAVLLEANWVWGVLFLLWVIPDLKHGSTHFLEHIERRKNPLVYWLVVSVWTLLSVYLIADSVLT